MVKTIAIEWFWNHSPRFKPWAMETWFVNKTVLTV